MPEQIIGSPTQNMMAVNNSGAVPMAAYSGGTIYPLVVNNLGELMTHATMTGSITIGSVSVSADSVFIQSGANLDLGSAWTTVGSVYVVNNISVDISTNPLPVSGAYFPGSNVILESLPTDSALNNPSYEITYITSGTATGVTGSSIGSIWQTIGVGSYAQAYTWNNDLIINVSSWGT